MATNITWDKADFDWSLAPTDILEDRHTWDLVQVITEVLEEIKGGRSKKKKVSEKNKVKVIRLIMYRKNIKVYDERKEVQNIKHHIEDIKLISEELKRNVYLIYG